MSTFRTGILGKEDEKLTVVRDINQQLRDVAASLRGRELPAEALASLPNMNVWIAQHMPTLSTEHWQGLTSTMMKMAGTMEADLFDKQLEGSDLGGLPQWHKRSLQDKLSQDWNRLAK